MAVITDKMDRTNFNKNTDNGNDDDYDQWWKDVGHDTMMAQIDMAEENMFGFVRNIAMPSCDD